MGEKNNNSVDRTGFSRGVLDQSPIGIVILSEDNRRLYANEAYADLYGGTVADLLADSATLNLVDLSRMREIAEDLTDNPKSTSRELELVRKDGATYWALVTAQSVEFEGEPARLCWIHDISARKAHEDSLRDKELNMRRLLDDAPVGVAITETAGGRVSFSNRKMASIFGVSEGNETGGQGTNFYNSEEDRQGLYRALDGEGRVAGHELRLRKEDGTVFWGMMALGPAPYIGPDARISWIMDIDRRRQAEEDLQNSELMIRTILDHLPAAVFMRTLDGTFRITNKFYRNRYKTGQEVFEGNRLTDIMSGPDADRFSAEDRTVIEREEEKEFVSVRAFEGEQRILSSVKFPIRDSDGRITGVGGLEVDVTEKEQKRRELEQAYDIITSSINYASRIQRSVLPTRPELASVFKDYFLIWEPRDVVGGDVALLRKFQDGFLIAIIDCTGHGVPGAFMTMVVTGALDQALTERPDADPDMILARMNQIVKRVLSQESEHADGVSDDGIECGLCLIRPDYNMLEFVGARFELWSVEEGDLEVIRGDKVGVGYRKTPLDQRFTKHRIDRITEKSFYITTDGMIDQVGGARNRSFGKKRIKETLISASQHSMRLQEQMLYRVFHEYEYGQERRDDVCCLGFTFKTPPLDETSDESVQLF